MSILPPLAAELFAAFAADVAATPSVTLRAGNALDDHRQPPPFEVAADSVSDGYLEQYPWGIGHLDAASWRHYLPFLMAYALSHRDAGNPVVEGLLNSLRPPDREPARLASLSPDQEALVTRFLETLAFGDPSPHQELACQVLGEWWIPNALYRPASRRPAIG
ncbi:MAG: hypothetical protein JNK22_08385 [Rhodocyclaceae bacterium]|nr:hypothetical protein [Rhodocyclaceae bacterium]